MRDYKLHHIGCVVNNIDVAKSYYVEVLNYKYKCSVIDEKQNLRAYFLEGNGHFLEILQKINQEDNSPVDKIVKCLGGGVYHHCYEVENLDKEIKYLEKNNFVKCTKKYLENDFFKYIFMITPDNYIIEFIENHSISNCCHCMQGCQSEC